MPRIRSVAASKQRISNASARLQRKKSMVRVHARLRRLNALKKSPAPLLYRHA